MFEQRGTRAFGLISSAAVMVMVTTIGASGQKPGPAEVAAKMTGVWKLNRELSPAIGAPGRGGPGGKGRGAAFSTSGAPAFQRGGRGGGELPTASSNADLPPDVLAAQAAIRDLQQIAELVTIKATTETLAIADPRGERIYSIDNKPTRVDTTGVKIDVRSRWDKLAVRQEFSSPQTRLIRSWEVDDEGHLVLKVKLESMTMSSKEVKAVYDRQ